MDEELLSQALAKLESLENQIQSIENQMREKDEIISHLIEQLDELNSKFNGLVNSINTKETHDRLQEFLLRR